MALCRLQLADVAAREPVGHRGEESGILLGEIAKQREKRAHRDVAGLRNLLDAHVAAERLPKIRVIRRASELTHEPSELMLKEGHCPKGFESRLYRNLRLRVDEGDEFIDGHIQDTARSTKNTRSHADITAPGWALR